QKGTVNDRENIPPVVSPVFLRQLGGHIGQLLGQVAAAHIVVAFQHRHDRRRVFLVQRPQPGGAGVFTGAGIGNIKHIPQPGPVARIVHQGDALGAAPHIPAHAVVPQVVFGAGSGVRALGVDHQLLVEWILVESGSVGEKARPFLPAAGELDRHLLRHLRVHFCFGWHGCLSSLPSDMKMGRYGGRPGWSKQGVTRQNPGTVPAHQSRRRSWHAAWQGYCRSGPAVRSRPAPDGHASRTAPRWLPGGCRGCKYTANWFPQKSKHTYQISLSALFLGAVFLCSGLGWLFSWSMTDFFLSRSSRWAAAAKSMREMGWPLRACCSSWATVGSLVPLLITPSIMP